jgi:hypothetical protein
MQLTSAECDRFYRVWFSLLLYTNRQHSLVKNLKEPANLLDLTISVQDVGKIREKVWKDDTLLDRFTAENPHQLSPVDLGLASSWRKRISGTFFIFRHLKKYTVFLDDSSPARAYGVLGLRSTFEEVIGPYLPVMVNAVLLPFEDKISYDGLLAPYPVRFGGGIRADLNDSYRDAKEREGVITQLGVELSAEEIAGQNAAANQRLLKVFEKHLYKSGLSPATVQRHMEVLALLIDSFLPEHYPGQLLREVNEQQLQRFLLNWLPQHAAPKHKKAHTSLKYFVRFLRDTGRIQWSAAQKILQTL